MNLKKAVFWQSFFVYSRNTHNLTMQILEKKYLIFFFVVLIFSPLIGLLLFQEEFNSVFVARALFTASLSTLIFFLINKRR
jgi:hypothetical protein